MRFRGFLAFFAFAILASGYPLVENVSAGPMEKHGFERAKRGPRKGVAARPHRDAPSGETRFAGDAIRRALEKDPDNPELHVRLGRALADAGYFADASTEFAFGAGTPRYEKDGIPFHADCLRALGRPRDAAALRLSQYLVAEKDADELRELLGAIDDYRAAGDLDEAFDLAWQAIAVFPEASATHAWLADVLIDQGEIEEAEFHLQFAEKVGQPVIRMDIVRARIALLDGDIIAARKIVDSAMQKKHRSARLVAMRADILRQMGEIDEAFSLLERSHWEGEYPETLAERAVILSDLGRSEEATEVMERATSIYPSHPNIEAAATYLLSSRQNPG